MRNLRTISDLDENEILNLIERALELKSGGKIATTPNIFTANLFFENSTRTKISFEIAQRKMGLRPINFEVANSSLSKGESLYDTCKTLEMLGVQLLVIRHPKEHYWEELEGLGIPIINAGDGGGEHPTQSLLDLMTIYEHFGRLKGLKVAIVGDTKNSRVSASDFKALSRFGTSVYLVAPKNLRHADPTHYVELDEVIGEVDVLMLLRVQRERHGEGDGVGSDYHQSYGLTLERYRRMKEGSVIMHPAPVNRGVEIASELVEAERSLIFRQMHNGVYMRQAILEFIIKAGLEG